MAALSLVAIPHGSVSEAVSCIRIAGAYVVAVDAGTMRALSSTEESEFHTSGRASQCAKLRVCCSSFPIFLNRDFLVSVTSV